MTPSQVIAILTLRLEKATGQKVSVERKEAEQFKTKVPTLFTYTGPGKMDLSVPENSFKEKEDA